MKNKLRLFIESNIASNFILGVIIYNSIILGLMTYPVLMAKFGAFLHYTNFACVIIFTIEMAIKLYVYGKFFFKDGWNNFDFILVAISWVPTGGVFSSFRAFRVLRALRALRLITRLSKLRLIVQAIIESVPNVAWASVLLMLIFYIFAIMGVSLFGTAFPEWFGSLGKAMYTLFQVMTLESWSMGISRPVMKVYPLAWIYFVPFVLTSSFIVMNVVVGIVVNSISEVAQINRVEKIEKDDIDYNIEMEVQVIKEHLANLEALMKKKHNE